MRFGVNFPPTFLPEQKSGAQYFAECLNLAERADQPGFASVRIVEHHFKPYGSASPNPIVYLSAASQRAPHVPLVTGAVVPAFNHPLKYAGELAMLHCISGGRLDAGFARAFLPDEFEAFGVSTEDSRARYEEGIAACVRLWTEETVTLLWSEPAQLRSRLCRRGYPSRSAPTARRAWTRSQARVGVRCDCSFWNTRCLARRHLSYARRASGE